MWKIVIYGFDRAFDSDMLVDLSDDITEMGQDLAGDIVDTIEDKGLPFFLSYSGFTLDEHKIDTTEIYQNFKNLLKSPQFYNQ